MREVQDQAAKMDRRKADKPSFLQYLLSGSAPSFVIGAVLACFIVYLFVRVYKAFTSEPNPKPATTAGKKKATRKSGEAKKAEEKKGEEQKKGEEPKKEEQQKKDEEAKKKEEEKKEPAPAPAEGKIKTE